MVGSGGCGGECYEYKWFSSVNSTRPFVWCQRSDGLNVTGGCPAINPPVDNSSCSPPCLMPKSFCSEDGICMCEEGFTEVLSPTGLLDQCAPIPILEIPTAGDKKGDVKTSRAINPTLPTTILPGRTGRTWYLQPYGPATPHITVFFLFCPPCMPSSCESSSYCAKVHRSLKAQESDANGTAVWVGQNAHEMIYTCPDCQELTQTTTSSSS
ncbi:Thrombospondin type-1 domain-containing protein 7A [Collichthys lucidus]|uniref:Thrombospondin type-1 domain-containing protein 7A n=1 Tax=Collichthys lucidus TaxID=240159 RepID=A0A4U5V5N8_COLLU|nr:Thrombospondin type-1 domain-containing protein 7A [Collichthys lucidus]